MSPANHRFGRLFLAGIEGDAKPHTGRKAVADFKSGAFTPILVAGILNPAGPTLTVFSLSKPDEDGEAWLCEHMLNPFQTTFHRMLRLDNRHVGFSPEGKPTVGVDEVLQAFARVHLAADQSFTPGTYHTYCAAVTRQATEAALLAWMEGSDSTGEDLKDLTDASLRTDFLRRASFARVQERIASKRKTTKADAEKLLRATLDSRQQAAERQGIVEGWDVAQARSPRLKVVTTTDEIKELFTLVASATAAGDGQPKGPTHPNEYYDVGSDALLVTRPDLYGQGVRRDGPAGHPTPRPAKPAEPTYPSDSWAAHWYALSKKHGKKGAYARPADGLEAWGQLTDGSSIQKSTRLSAWPDIIRAFDDKKFALGQFAVRHPAIDFEGRPGVTFVFTAAGGGSRVARAAMTIFSGYNLGGALADSIQGDRWASLTYLYSPHWYAASRDRSFGADWATRENTGADDAEGRKLWCAGIEHAIRQVLAELPESCVDGLYFDSYAANDRLDRLTARQLKGLTRTKAEDLAKILALPEPPDAGLWASLFG